MKAALLLAGAAVSARATGFFGVEQGADGAWWLVTPEGDRTVSKGVTCVNWDDSSPQGGPTYGNTTLHKYGTSANWSATAEQRLQDWGFNTLGAWTYTPSEFSLPYTVSLSFAGLGDDWLDPAFTEAARAYAQEQAAPLANDSRLVGYFTGNELDWGSFVDRAPVVPRENNTLLLRYLGFDEAAPGRAAAQSFLSDRYNGSIAALNEAWGTDAADFATLPLRYLRPNEARYADSDAFLGAVAAPAYFQAAHDALRAADPNHLILGTRYSFWEMPRAAVAAEAPYTDVTSYNGYKWYPGHNVSEWVGRVSDWAGGNPVLVSEFAFRADNNTSEDPNTKGAGWPVPDQATRTAELATYLQELMAQPAAVGYHWFQWSDEPPMGRFDGENSNFGLVDVYDRPYDELLEAFAAANAAAEGRHGLES